MTEVNEKVPFFESFAKSQFSSLIATSVDMSALVFLTEVGGIYYVMSAGIGAFFGACISFILGRNWAFRKKDGKLTIQAFRYLMTSATSLVLNTAGIYALTDWLGIQYIISKVIISLIIGICFNFVMYRYFVYR